MYNNINKYIPYLFLLPASILFVIFFFIPFFQTLLISFQDFSCDIYNPSFTGLFNYKFLLHSKEFQSVLINTFLFLIIVVPVLTILPLFIAIVLKQIITLQNFYKIIIYLPVVISIVVCAIAFKWLYSQNGILNYILNLLHMKPIEWLTNTKYALFSVAILTIWKGIGYYMMIYLAALLNVPQDLYDACDIDGANFLQKHLFITVPQICPSILLVFTISSISAMKVFVEIYVLTKGGPLNSTKTIVYYIYEKAFENLDLGLSCAASVYLLIIVLGLSISNFLFFEKKRFKL